MYYGCANDKFGGCGSILSLHRNSSTKLLRFDYELIPPFLYFLRTYDYNKRYSKHFSFLLDIIYVFLKAVEFHKRRNSSALED